MTCFKINVTSNEFLKISLENLNRKYVRSGILRQIQLLVVLNNLTYLNVKNGIS